MEKIKFDGPKKLALVAAILGFIAIFAADYRPGLEGL